MKKLVLFVIIAGLFFAGCSTEGSRKECMECMISSAQSYYPYGGSAVPNNQPYAGVFYKDYGVNPTIDTDYDNLSTFGVDVDTASYSIARRYLNDGNIPPKEVIRIEEFVNFFDYEYPSPRKDPIGVSIDGAPAWLGRSNNYILRIGINTKNVDIEERKNAILTFVIDTSGSMDMENRLELVKKCLRLLVNQMQEGDRIGIVEYSSEAKLVLKHRGIQGKSAILSAIDGLSPGGSTCAEDGLKLGYELACESYKDDCINRVILCSDGVANVGKTGPEEILKEIERYKKKGICLSTVGFGMGNYNDILMEQLADKGNGNYSYVDSIEEGKRVFVENLLSILQVVAKDVKVQVEFNEDVVRNYRLIGYENRAIKDEKFKSNKQDGGEIGAGHTVTALYEIRLWKDKGGNIATVDVRYKDPEENETREIKQDVFLSDLEESFEDSSEGLKLAVVVAEFAGILKKSYWSNADNIEDILELAEEIPHSRTYRNDEKVEEFVGLVGKAKKLLGGQQEEED